MAAASPGRALLAEVLALLPLRLADIVARAATGAPARAGLGPRPLARLVDALFEDTPARRAAMAAILEAAGEEGK